MKRFLLFALLPILSACGGGSPAAPAAPSAPVQTPTPAPTPAATARYRVTFDASWSAATHPTDFPGNAHFSGLIGGTHGPAVSFWQEGGLATEGIRLMAERGRQSPLDLEVGAGVGAGTAQHVLAGDDVPRSPGSTTLEFGIGRDFPLVTLVTMVAPSPDWFVGVSGLSLIEGGAWVEEKRVLLHPYDAGTDSGVTFTSADVATQPRDAIRRIDMGPLVEAAAVPHLGTFTFRRIP
jgi:spondin N